MCIVITIVTSIVLLTSPFVVAETPVLTDPENAGIEYALQGEYLGKVETDEGPTKIGAQLIALGDSKFRVVGYVGGLPGDGWSRGDDRHSTMDGQRNGDAVTFTGEDNATRAIVKNGTITIFHDGQEHGQLAKITRESPTLGAEPPEGAIVLFDGRNTDAWEDGQIVQDEYLGATGVATKQKFGDHSLHIEFRTPFMPKSTGQARGNSGVYLQSRYELQVLDSFGLEGQDNECGGIYSIAQPAVNMCLPPLSWQTYDIDFTAARYNEDGAKIQNARVTIRHNDVVIHDDLELPHGTPGRHSEEPGPDALFLQDHGNPVVFRNIWLIEK